MQQSKHGPFQPESPDEGVQWFADDRAKNPMKMERRKMSQCREFRDRQRVGQVILDVINHPIDALPVKPG